jgi:ribosomal-protein-alanine N-acetyltransferase
MRKEDLPQVTEIDQEAFPTLWPPANYQRELNNRLAYYIVACDEEERVEPPEPKATPQKGSPGLVAKLRQLFNHDRFFGNEPPPSRGQYIFGFAGFWIMAGEAHITNIAVREQHRRQGIGELLLISLTDLAIELGARLITLEVRTSNITAQSLYSKYGFTQVGLRRGYYTDNREDGVLMSLEDIASAPVQANLQQLKQAHAQKWGIIATMLPPRTSPAQPNNQ